MEFQDERGSVGRGELRVREVMLEDIAVIHPFSGEPFGAFLAEAYAVAPAAALNDKEIALVGHREHRALQRFAAVVLIDEVAEFSNGNRYGLAALEQNRLGAARGVTGSDLNADEGVFFADQAGFLEALRHLPFRKADRPTRFRRG